MNAYRAENLGRPDRRADADDLAGRLTRLPAGHPSADPALAEPGVDDLGLDDVEPGDSEPLNEDADDLDYVDDLDPTDISPEDPDDGATAGDRRPRQTGDFAAWGEPGGPARSPYRPWFGADGARDPWFAPDPTE